jgi:hypothetical protein
VKPHERVVSYGVFCTVLEVMYMGVNGDMRIYIVLLKEIHVQIKMHAKVGSYNRSNFSRFVYNCISLSGTLSL